MMSESFSISNCRICNSTELDNFFSLGDQPLANQLRPDPFFPQNNYPLELTFCRNCSTVQLTHTIDPSLLFSEYVWVTGTSRVAKHYSQQLCNYLLDRSPVSKPFIVEIASNDGTFLKPFIDKNLKVLGVDPASNICDIANANNIPTKCAFFGANTANDLVSSYGKADIIFARNVLPHVPDPHDIISGVADLLSDDGVFAVEFHSAHTILNELHYDSIYHEHYFYHSCTSLISLMKSHCLYPFDLTISPISGGSCVLYFTRDSVRKPTSSLTASLDLERDSGITSIKSWKVFAENCTLHSSNLRRLIVDFHQAGNSIVGYGASARSSTLLNYLALNSETIKYIADISPHKAGKFSPGSNIPIVHPDKVFSTNPDVILLLAWNFTDEIIDTIKNVYQWSGTVVLPLPNEPRVISI